MTNTCIHCGDWIGSTADRAPKHREGCPLRMEPPVPESQRLAERRFMFDYIADSLEQIAKPHVGKPRQMPEDAHAALAEFFSDPGVQARVNEQVTACALRGHDGYCPACSLGGDHE